MSLAKTGQINERDFNEVLFPQLIKTDSSTLLVDIFRQNQMAVVAKYGWPPYILMAEGRRGGLQLMKFLYTEETRVNEN